MASVLAKCLEYRWKGFDAAAAWYVRGRRYHDLLRSAFTTLYPKAVVEKATEALAKRAAAELRGEVLDTTAVQRVHERNVKGGPCEQK